MYQYYPYMNQVIASPYYNTQPQFNSLYVGQQPPHHQQQQQFNYYQQQMQH